MNILVFDSSNLLSPYNVIRSPWYCSSSPVVVVVVVGVVVNSTVVIIILLWIPGIAESTLRSTYRKGSSGPRADGLREAGR